MNREVELMKIIKDKSEDLSTRDDAAMDIGKVGTEKSFYDLVTVSSDPNEDEIFLQSCGESLGEIFCRIYSDKFKHQKRILLISDAFVEAHDYVRVKRPDLIVAFESLFGSQTRK